MFAKNLEFLLTHLCQKGDVSGTPPGEMAERFEALRGYRRLPHGRERRDQQLTSGEIAAAILGLVSINPRWAGHVATILRTLCPVGGVGASFFGASTLQEAVERALTDVAARKSVIRLTVSGSESGINSHGRATLIYEIDGARERAFFVPNGAVSRLQSGAERNFDPEALYSPTSREMSFNRTFFERVTREIEMAKAHPGPPAGDGSEYDDEEAQQERYRKLGVRPNSRFLNIGVDNQVTWPQEETVVKFDEYHLVLMPKTRDHVQSIHVDLVSNRLTDREAMTVINRYLSIMTWCDDQFAVAQDGWSGNPIPKAVPKRDLAFTTASHWAFDRKIPASAEARRALALYREARNAEQNFLVSYAVLNFFKVIEIGYQDRGRVKNWFRDYYALLKEEAIYKDAFARFAEYCEGEKPHEYIYNACRIAVAHANKKSKSDPDDVSELNRLHVAAEILRIFARHFIKNELGVSDVMYSGE
jgi:methylamine utilization protein MauJ